MAVDIKIDSTGLLTWAAYLDKIPSKTPIAIAAALNQFGDSFTRAIENDAATRTGLSAHDIHSQLAIKRATPDSLNWEIDVSKIGSSSTTSRPWVRRQWAKGEEDDNFEPGELVNVVTREDNLVCQLCLDISEEGPYTVEEASNKIPAHVNCRCIMLPYVPMRRVPVTFSTRMGPPPRGGGPQGQLEGISDQLQHLTVKQLVKLLENSEFPFTFKAG